MTITKPGVTIRQTLTSDGITQSGFRPTVIIGPRYNVHEEEYLGNYDSTQNTDYSYPNKESLAEVDTTYNKLYAKNIYLKYYENSHTWKKVGTYPNRIRTILADNLVFKTPGISTIFQDRGVVVGDKAIITIGTSVQENSIIGYAADQTTSSVGTATANSGNQATQAHNISAVTSGSGQSSVTPTTSGTFTGDLIHDILTTTYTITVIQGGDIPAITVTQASGADYTMAVNAKFDSEVSDVYRFRITKAGAAGTAEFIVTSSNGDNSTAATVVPVGLTGNLGTLGLVYTLSTAEMGPTFELGEEWLISAVPSTAMLRIANGLETTERVFPGYAKAFSCGMGVSLSLASARTDLPVNFYWTFTATKQVAGVTCTAGGTYIGTVDSNYFIRVLQGGEWDDCIVEVTGTGLTRKLITVEDDGGSPEEISLGNGVTLQFADNIQNGLIKDDIFSVPLQAANDIAYRTLILQDSISSAADVTSIDDSAYSGINLGHYTITPSGDYLATNPGLELYGSETYIITVTTRGIWGEALLSIQTLSGYGEEDDVVTPSAQGETIELSYGLNIAFSYIGEDPTFQAGDSWTVTISKATPEVDLVMSKTDTEISQYRVEDESTSAWTSTGDEVTINSNIKLGHDDWTGYLYIYSAALYLTYKALHTIGANTLLSISSESEISSYVGSAHIDNPVGYGVYMALLNSNGYNIRAMYVSSNDLDGYTELFNKLELSQNVYRIALMDFTDAHIDLLIAHINKMSSKNKWRAGYVCKQVPSIFTIAEGTATIAENPNDPGVYTLFKTTDMNFSLCVIGDIVNYLGNIYLVSEIISSTELVIDTDFGSAQTVAATTTITRVPSVSDKKDMYIYYANSIDNRKIINIVPSVFDSTKPGYYLAAAVAGLKAGVYAFQPVTNYVISGCTTVSSEFTEDQLDEIASAGNLIITQDNSDSSCYIRHQLTTDPETVKTREISIMESLDDISYVVYDVVSPYIGKYNIRPGILAQIYTNLTAALYSLTELKNDTAGQQILSFEILKIEQSTTQEDKLIIQLGLTLPSPINYIEVEIII